MISMKLSAADSRNLSERESVGRLATVSRAGQPHAVPVTFAVLDDRVVIGIDEKPKSTTDLKRLRNIRENGRVAVIWDRYDDDWHELWWVRADGEASVEEDGSFWDRSWAALNDKYPQYEGRSHDGPVIVIDVDKWSGWAHG